MTIKGGTNKACAACKYQRRRCSKDCPLSPYFPADQTKRFSNAHRLFGVANIKRILKEVDPKQKDEAMKSIIFESDMRAQYPVTGCLGIIWNYNNQILNAMQELRYLKMRLAIYKERFHSQQILPPDHTPDSQMGVPAASNDSFSIYNHLQNNNDSEIGVFDGNGVYGNTYIESAQQATFNAMAAQSTSPFIANQQGMDIAAEYDMPFDAMVDDRQSFTECREPCKSRYTLVVVLFLIIKHVHLLSFASQQYIYRELEI